MFVPGVGEVEEHVDIEAFVAESLVEALNEAVLGRPAWPDEVQLHAVLVRPDVHGTAAELRAVVQGDGQWQSAAGGQDVEAGDHLGAGEREIGPEQRTFPSKGPRWRKTKARLATRAALSECKE